jgi:hypothetical protein
MKKSKCFRLAQMAVLGADALLPSDKLDILRVLMEEENVQKICEKHTEEKESEVDPY